MRALDHFLPDSANEASATRTLVLVSWDGRSQPLGLIVRDAVPAFELVLFDYSGGHLRPKCALPIIDVLRAKTECKGQIFQAFHSYLSTLPDDYEYVALIDDDIAVDVSALNKAIAIGTQSGLDSFALSLTPDSYCLHRRFFQQKGSFVRGVAWVEVMMPFYRKKLFDAAAPFFQHSISSYGIDQFAMPLAGKLSGCERAAVIDARTARHVRPITSDRGVFSNGLTARQERLEMRRRCLQHVRWHAQHLLGTRWYYRCFAPADSLARFWLLYLGWPWHVALRLVSTSLRRQRRAVPPSGTA